MTVVRKRAYRHEKKSHQLMLFYHQIFVGRCKRYHSSGNCVCLPNMNPLFEIAYLNVYNCPNFYFWNNKFNFLRIIWVPWIKVARKIAQFMYFWLNQHRIKRGQFLVWFSWIWSATVTFCNQGLNRPELPLKVESDPLPCLSRDLNSAPFNVWRCQY